MTRKNSNPSKKIEINITPRQGWEQFLAARQEMLDSYDIARTKSRARVAHTHHGVVAEAEFRKWLSDFLPKKYGVTSGYIVSAGVPDTEANHHFDVIIYDHLEAPVLWIEDGHDTAGRGRTLAIPAEYVKAVIEVKSVFSNKTAKEAVDHLMKLQKLANEIDSPGERYKKHLPPDFFCVVIFFELKKEKELNFKALESITKGYSSIRFMGGLILRGEGCNNNEVGRIFFMSSETQSPPTFTRRGNSLLNSGIGSSLLINGVHIAPSLTWVDSNFSQFAFDLLAHLNNTFEPGRMSSYLAFGSSCWKDHKNHV